MVLVTNAFSFFEFEQMKKLEKARLEGDKVIKVSSPVHAIMPKCLPLSVVNRRLEAAMVRR